MAEQQFPDIGEYLWGEYELMDDAVVMESDADGGYRCPLCLLNFQTKRKDIFQKHFNPGRKNDLTKHWHMKYKQGIPTIKERCPDCGKPGDPNIGKKKKHKTVCKESLNLNNNEKIEANDDKIEEQVEEVNDDRIKIEDEEKLDETVEYEDAEYENMLIDEAADERTEGHEEYEGNSMEDSGDMKAQFENNEEKLHEEISLLRSRLEISQQKQREEEKKAEELVIKFNSYMKVKDSQLNEMEQSVTLLETVRLAQMEELKQKLKFATGLLETVNNKGGDKGKDLEEELKTERQMKKNMEVRLLKLEEKLKHKDDENQERIKEALDTKQEISKVVEGKITLEAALLKMTNKSEDLQYQLSLLKEKAQKDKDHDAVKINNLKEKLKNSKEVEARQDKLRKETQSNLDKANKTLNEVLEKNSKYKEENETQRKINTQLVEKVQSFEQTQDADKKLPMIKTIKADRLDEEKSLGEGAYASVFKGVYKGKQIAIKKAEIGAESIKEAFLMCKIRHSHVVSAIGVSIQNQNLLISMECYDQDLSVHLENTEKNKDLRHEWRLKVFKDCARGLKYLHNLKIIHRDLKPQNILLKHAPNSISASLADFGIAQLGLEGVGWAGTPGFIAPGRSIILS